MYVIFRCWGGLIVEIQLVYLNDEIQLVYLNGLICCLSAVSTFEAINISNAFIFEVPLLFAYFV